MTRLIKTTLGFTAATLLAATAQAGGLSSDATVKVTSEAPVSQTVKTIDADGQVGELTFYRTDVDGQQAAVLGAFEAQETDAYIVQNNDGDLFINHLVPIADLPDPTLEVAVVDTYTTEYRGMVFTNKVLDEQ